MNEQGFNLLRLNCLLSDSKLLSPETLTKSLLCDYLYMMDNKPQPISVAFSHIVDSYHVPIIIDEFNRDIVNDSKFVIDRNGDEASVVLRDDVYEKVRAAVSEGSIEKEIEDFVIQCNYPESYKTVLIEMLYHSIYVNVSYFDVDDLRSIIPVDLEKQFQEIHVSAFNKFLDNKQGEKKNGSLYQLFFKAIQFALLTSGKAVNQYSQHFFKEKNYYLDTNTIVRMLGVGGQSRQKGLLTLVRFCRNHGVRFAVSEFSYGEFRKIITAHSDLINRYGKGAVDLVVESGIDLSSIRLADGFIRHFIEVKKINKNVQTAEQYQRYLEFEFGKMCTDLDIRLEHHSRHQFKDRQVDEVAAQLRDGKVALKPSVRYSEKSARYDAQNVLYIRELRGYNDYNFQSIKYFYLTTDGLLNQVLQGHKQLTAESILPSQLYLLHTGLLSREDEEPDYDLFVSFLKRRTNGVHITGQDLIKYINDVRVYTEHPSDVKAIVESYVNMKYRAIREGKIYDGKQEPEIPPIVEYANSYLRDQIENLEPQAVKAQDMYELACARIPDYYRRSKRLTNAIDVLSYLVIGLAAFYFGTLVQLPPSFLYGLVAVSELIKLVHSKMNGMRKLNEWIFYKYVESDAYFRAVGKKDEFFEYAENFFANY